MKILQRKRDGIILALFIPLAGGSFAYAIHDLRTLEEELDLIAAPLIDNWFNGGEENRDDFDIIALVEAGKSLTYFGSAWGQIHLYFHHKDDQDFATFAGIEYLFIRDQDEWVMTDSSGCTAPEHHSAAFKEFEKRGIKVPQEVYDRIHDDQAH